LSWQAGGVGRELQQGDIFGIGTQRGVFRQEIDQPVAPLQLAFIHQPGNHFAGHAFTHRSQREQGFAINFVAIHRVGIAIPPASGRAVAVDDPHRQPADFFLPKIAMHHAIHHPINILGAAQLPDLFGVLIHLHLRQGAA